MQHFTLNRTTDSTLHPQENGEGQLYAPTVSDVAAPTPEPAQGGHDRLAAEDRCHLNSLALDDGRARYMAAYGYSIPVPDTSEA
jgi:hypothetical protein